MATVCTPWLDKNRIEQWLKCPVTEINTEDITQKGENYLSEMKKLEVRTENGKVYPLVVKCRVEVGATAELLKEASFFIREQDLYRNVFPQMSRLLREALPESFEEITAKSYDASRNYLVFEDLKASGFKMANRMTGLDLDQCLLVMRTLAKFHAASAVLHQQDPSSFKTVHKSLFSEPAIREPLQKLWQGFALTLANEVDTWGEEWHKYAVKLRHAEGEMMERLKEVLERVDSGFNVLNHGDLWTNNMMFRNRAEGIRFLDFQFSHFTSPGFDLIYFLTSSVSMEVRVKYIDQLVEEYHKSLCRTLTALGYNQELITLQQVHNEIDKKAFYGVFTLLGPFVLMQLQPDSEFSLGESLTTGRNPGSVMYGENLRDIVKITLPILDSKGAFDVEFPSPLLFLTRMEEPWLDKNRMEMWLKTPVKEILAEDNTAKGENYLSNMKKVEVKTESGEIYPMVVKCRMEVGKTAEVFRNTTIFNREQEMYRHTLNRMSKLVREAVTDGFEEFSAKSYYTCKSFLVLENLNASGFKMENRMTGLDLDQCLLVMRTLAKFHAASAVLHEQDPSAFGKFHYSVFSEEAIQEPFGKFLTGMTRTLAEELDTWGEEWQKYSEKLKNSADGMMKRVSKITQRVDSGFNVLIHGDLWTNNMMFRNRAEGIRFLDFQLAHFGSPGIDLNYFIITSTSLEVRRHHRDTLVQEYHNTLCSTLTALGYKKKLLTLEELDQEMARLSFYGVFALVAPYAVMQLSHDSQFSFDESLTTGYNPGPSMYGEMYKETVKMLLPLYDSQGAFDVTP